MGPTTNSGGLPKYSLALKAGKVGVVDVPRVPDVAISKVPVFEAYDGAVAEGE
jgi:hypothetical protein